MRDEVIQSFHGIFRHDPRFVVRAPGRATLMGDHTDYNAGYVLTMALQDALWVAAAPRADAQLCVVSLDYGHHQSVFGLDALADDTLPPWTRHLRSAWRLLHQQGIQPGGANIVIGSQLPPRSGMASSAAMGVAAIECGLSLVGEAHEPLQKARWAALLEADTHGIASGGSDEVAVAAAQAGAALFVDCQAWSAAAVPLPETVRLMVLDTQVQADDAPAIHAQRRAETAKVAEQLGSLRDLTPETLDAAQDQLDPELYRRARHVVTENARVLAVRDALVQGDLAALGPLFRESHLSLKENFAVSTPELDAVFAIAQETPGCLAVRMMGGGLGGACVAVVEASAQAAFVQQVHARYTTELGLSLSETEGVASAGSTVEYV
ncbi:MAG: galactokinase [Anaerolineales bacterium]